MSAAVVRELDPEKVIALRERLVLHVNRSASCWHWTGFIGEQGYGQFAFRVAGRMHGGPAHRWAYELLIGPIPDGHDLDHTCCVAGVCPGGRSCPHRSCVNPAHLEPVTPLENTTRAAPNRPAPWQLQKTHCPQNHPYEGANLIRSQTGRRYCRACRDARNAARAEAHRGQAVRAKTLSFFAQIQNYKFPEDRNYEAEIPVPKRRGAPKKMRCKRGHPLVDFNLVWHAGNRACRACRRLRRMDPVLRAEVEQLLARAS